MRRTKTDRRLWHRLEGYSFHERPLTRSLVDRLEEETGHSTDICYTLVEEYRRYMYLVGSTGDTLAPSPIVNLVWKLHSEDEKAYFEDFCPRIIGRTIHHNADLPPFEDDPAYLRTLEYYAQEFGRPQVQYWPDPDFASVQSSTAIFWIISIAAFVLALLLDSVLFAAFGAGVILITFFLRWKFSSLPLRGGRMKGGARGRPV
ncbi:MAG: hypothetical protein AAFU41_08040 [Pseudomonadota bacterium]